MLRGGATSDAVRMWSSLSIAGVGTQGRRHSRSAPMPGILHHGGNLNAQDSQRADQFATNHRHGRQKKLFSLFIRLAENRMPVVKRVEQLRQPENVLRQKRGLSGRDATVHNVRSLRSS